MTATESFPTRIGGSNIATREEIWILLTFRGRFYDTESMSELHGGEDGQVSPWSLAAGKMPNKEELKSNILS